MAISTYKWFLAKCLLPVALVLTLAGWRVQAPEQTGAALPLHPFFVSVTEINHNAKDKTLEISCKLFTNDFESVLEKNLHTKIDLSAPANKKASDGYIAAYVEKNIQIRVDGKPVVLQFVGSEKEQDATWSYFQADNVPAVKKMDITNTLLYDGFDKEINIMHVSVGGERRSGKLDYPEKEISFQW